MDGDEQEGVQWVIDSDLTREAREREMDAISGDVEGVITLEEFPAAFGHDVTDGATEDAVSYGASWEVEYHGRS